jgi:hypothetical protein
MSVNRRVIPPDAADAPAPRIQFTRKRPAPPGSIGRGMLDGRAAE